MRTLFACKENCHESQGVEEARNEETRKGTGKEDIQGPTNTN